MTFDDALDDLRDEYVPKVEMTKEEADIILGYLEDDSFFNLLSGIGIVTGKQIGRAHV